jgi:YggT family protein
MAMGFVFMILFWALQLFNLVLLARVLLSWFPDIDRSHPIIQFLYDITEPVLRPVRELLPQTGMIDLSPLVVFLVIQVLLRLLSGFAS